MCGIILYVGIGRIEILTKILQLEGELLCVIQEQWRNQDFFGEAAKIKNFKKI